MGKLTRNGFTNSTGVSFFTERRRKIKFVDRETESKPDLKNKTSDFFSILTRPKIEQ